MASSKKDFQKVFKKVVTELGSCRYDKWSFITVKYKKMDTALGSYFLHNDLRKIITQKPNFLLHIKFDELGKPTSLKPINAESPVPVELLQLESSVLNEIRSVTLRSPYWILFRDLFEIHFNKKRLSSQEQWEKVNEVYARYCVEDKREQPVITDNNTLKKKDKFDQILNKIDEFLEEPEIDLEKKISNLTRSTKNLKRLVRNT